MIVLVTGASSGFGRLIALQLKSRGHSVTAALRNSKTKNLDAANTLNEHGCHIVEIDVTDDKSVESGVDQAIAHHGKIDAVINNAGICGSGYLETFTPGDCMKLFDVNVFGAQRMNRAVLPHMRRNRFGVLMHISSLAGRIAVPYSGIYNASKHALEAIAEGYRWECSSFGVDSVIVEPGGFQTDFFSRMTAGSDHWRAGEYGNLSGAPEIIWNEFKNRLRNNPKANPLLVVEAVVELLSMPHGKRPLRTVVDCGQLGPAVAAMNKDRDVITAGFFDRIRLGSLLNLNSHFKGHRQC